MDRILPGLDMDLLVIWRLKAVNSIICGEHFILQQYNITIDGNEYHHNLNYAVDPHSGTHDMNITNNWVHHNSIGIICSVNCYDILVEGNKVENNIRAGIFFSRNMTDSKCKE